MRRIVFLISVTLSFQLGMGQGYSVSNVKNVKSDDEEGFLSIDVQAGVTTNLLMRDYNMALAGINNSTMYFESDRFENVPFARSIGIRKTIRRWPSVFFGYRGIFNSWKSRERNGTFNLNTQYFYMGYQYQVGKKLHFFSSFGVSISTVRFEAQYEDFSNEQYYGALLSSPDRVTIRSSFESINVSVGGRYYPSSIAKYRPFYLFEIMYGIPTSEESWNNGRSNVVNGPRITQYPLTTMLGIGIEF